MKNRAVLFLLAAAMPLAAWCADGDLYEAQTLEGQAMVVKVISEAEKTLQVGNGNTSSISTSYTGEVTIPETIEDYTVVAIGDFAFRYCKFQVINIPKSVKTIGLRSFEGCSSLLTANMVNGLETIGCLAFDNCYGMTAITIPNTVKTIEDNAFDGCSAATSLTIGQSVESIGEGAFKGCVRLTGITIPESVTAIGASAFYNCKAATTLTIEGTVSDWGNGVFNKCSAIQSASLAEGNTIIPNSCFEGCSSLASIEMPSTIKTIDEYAFYDCSSLATITIPDGVTTIGRYAFRASGLTSVSIPNSVETIGEAAFTQNSSLASVKLPDGLTTIENYLFNACGKLTQINIPASVTSIGNSAFNNCYNLQFIVIPSKVVSVGESAFYYCSRMTTMTFDNCAPSLGTSFIGNCSKLKEVYYPAFGYSYFSLNSYISKLTQHPYIKLNNEWETYCTTGNLEIPEGIEAYVVEGYSGGKAQLKQVTMINKNQGLLLKAASVGQMYECSVNGSPVDYEENLLKGVISNQTIAATEGENTNLVFYEGKFYKATDETVVPAYTAYLQIPTTALSGSEPSIDTVIDPIPDDPTTRKCATPVIKYENGQLKLTCDTKNVEFVTRVTSADVKSHYTESITFAGKYNISVIAKKEGYKDSDEATAEINMKGKKGDVNEDGKVTITDAVGVVNIILEGEE